MVIASGPTPQAHCGTEFVVPNRLIKVWIGADGCPRLNGLVSLLTAALRLEPDEIIYLASHEMDTTSARCDALHRCLADLGVRWRRIHTEDGSEFKEATRDFVRGAELHSFTLRGSSTADIVRQFALNRRGGYYLDE